MIINVSSATALQSALAAAQSGDTILLAPGNYGTVKLTGLHFATDVTIASSGAPALFTGLQISNSNGLTFQNLELKLSTEGAFFVTKSQDIHLDGFNVHGSLDGNARNDVGGMLIRESSDVSVTNSEFQQLVTGVAHLDSDHISITGNSLHDLRMDAVRGGGSDDVTVSRNVIGKFWPASGDHSDAIQFWTTGATSVTKNIVITDNVYLRGGGSGATTQGIFLGDESDRGYENVTISGNLMAGSVYNGIWVHNVKNLAITNNVVTGFTDMKSFIYFDGVYGGTITGNSANTYVQKNVVGATVSGNATISQVGDLGAAVYAQWLAAHDGEPAAPPPPPPPLPANGGGLNLPGTAANDVLTGGSGADTLGGGGGADTMTGGAGEDVYVLTGAGKVVEAAGGGVDTVRSAVTLTLADNVENAVLTGAAWSRASGNALDNQLSGSATPNVLSGFNGADTLDGGAGADSLSGGNGDDVMIGGAGADRFHFDRFGGHDVIRDFGAGGEADTLYLASFLGAGLTPTLTDLGTDLKVSFSTGEYIILQGVDAADLMATTTGYISA